MADPLPKRPSRPREPARDLDLRDFPGCVAVSMTAAELEDYDGRIEYWEARTSTAIMVAEPTTAYHEAPSRGLGGLIREVAMARGSEILALGSTDLVQFDEHGVREVLMQADETYFLHRPWPRDKAIDVDVGPLPGVVLEVDHTTDVRRRRLEVYANWAFPEVWVEVPSPAWMAPRTSGRPRLTIYLLQGAGYVESAVSRAFPGWQAAEIHRALNEETRSEETVAAVRRVGRRMGMAGGTGPDDDAFLRAERAESRAEGAVQGRAEGRLDEARLLIRGTLEDRGVPVTAAVDAWLADLDSSTDSVALMAAAVRCRDADDFLRRVRPAGDAPPRSG